MTTHNSHWKKTAFVVVFLLIHSGIVYNFYLLSKDTVLGDASAGSLLVTPRYDFMRIPANDLAKRCDAVNRISADFAQVYFPARLSSTTAYTSETNDPWLRPSRYAPLVHIACRYTLCSLPYGYASLLHILSQLVLLYISFIYAFRVLQIQRYLLPSLLLVNIILFLTPVGLSWFERGQFSVYITLAYLWLFLGIIKRNPYHLVLSALFAFIKWTSFPFMFMAVSLWILNIALTRRDIRELKATLFLAALIPLTIAFLFLFNIKDGLTFLHSLYIQEVTSQPVELSMVFLVPKYFVKSFPFVLVALGCLYIWKNNSDYSFLAPYLCAAGILSLTYPTVAYDYSTPCLFCFMPLLAYWAELTNEGPPVASKVRISILARLFRIRRCLPHLPLYFFCFFLSTASIYNVVARRVDIQPRSAVYFYIVCAIILMVISTLQERMETEDHQQYYL